MTSHDITLVKESFRKLAPIADQAAALFYARLFELDPSLRHLFHNDMEAQEKKLMQMIGMAVQSLDRLEALVPLLAQLGARHVGYGVREEHYATVGAALLWALEKSLGREFTPAVKQAWSETYGLIADTMMAGARAAASVA